MKRTKIIERIRVNSPDPAKFLRLHRAEFGQEFYKKKINWDKFYPDIQSLINKISNFLRIGNENLLLGSGAESIIKDVFFYHSNNFDKKNILIFDPNYYMYEHYAKLLNYKITKYNLLNQKTYYLTSKEIIKIIKKNKITLLSLVLPSAPIEKNIKKTELLKIIKYCRKKKIFIIIDEVYGYFESKKNILFIKKYLNLIIIRSFSKLSGYPGIRFGIGLVNKMLFKKLDSLRLSVELSSYTTEKVKYLIDNFSIIKKNQNQIKKTLNYFIHFLKSKKYKCFNKSINSVSFYCKSNTEKEKIIREFEKKKIVANYNYKCSNLLLNVTTSNIANIKIVKKILSRINR